MTSYTKKAVKGVATVFVISIISAFLGYLVRLVLARNLSVEEFGLFYAVFAFLALLTIFKSFGIDKALVKFIPEFLVKKQHDKIKTSIIIVAITQLLTNTVMLTLIYLLSNYLASSYFHNTQAAIVLKLMVIAFFLDSFITVLKFIFQGFQKMTLFSGIDIIRMGLILIVISIFFRLNYKLLSPIIAYTITPVILLVIFIPVFIKNVYPNFLKSRFVFKSKLLKDISKYGILVLSVSLGVVVIGYTDTIILTYFTGVAAVGLYNVALPTAKIITYIPRSIIGVLLPLSSELWTKNKKAILKEGMESLYKYTILIVVPLVFLMFSFADLIILIFFGNNYIPASNALKILAIAMVFSPLYAINGAFFSGIGKPEISSKIVYSGAAFNLVFNIILIPKYGILGAAFTTFFSYIVMVLVGLKDVRKLINLKMPVKIWSKTLVAGIIFTYTIFLLKQILIMNVWVETSIILIISGTIYTSLLFLFRVINMKEVKQLYKRILKN